MADLISVQGLADLISDQGLADLISEQGLDFFWSPLHLVYCLQTYSRQHKSMIVWCSQNAPRQLQFHKAPAMSQPNRAVSASLQYAIFKMRQ